MSEQMPPFLQVLEAQRVDEMKDEEEDEDEEEEDEDVTLLLPQVGETRRERSVDKSVSVKPLIFGCRMQPTKS